MLHRKTVAIDADGMHLWNEMGDFICSYDTVTDREMCRFLRMMLDEGTYGPRDRLEGLPADLAA